MLDFFKPDNEKKLRSSLKNILGFSPGNISLYMQAFRHTSAAKEVKHGVKDSNERLEFLGDSVISTVVADFLFKKYPYKDEGFLTKMRSRLVSRDHLNQLSLRLGLNRFIDQNTDGNTKRSSMNGDAFEALIGAVYLDKGFTVAQNLLLKRILRYHVDVDKVIETETDFKSKLIEWGQKERKEVEFKCINDSSRPSESDKDRQFMVAVYVDGEPVAETRHFSKKKAEQLAAEASCVKLGIA